ncbi:hypothetical protein [Streptomyces sp. CC208A]|uniref:hypothetical protein n=1 Tax=Streptomyces sp. CC208A TaxID=3044573 RepID=UPI0024A93150|nr:hypothetical protein [Streptomyces sp. CC208A]
MLAGFGEALAMFGDDAGADFDFLAHVKMEPIVDLKRGRSVGAGSERAVATALST